METRIQKDDNLKNPQLVTTAGFSCQSQPTGPSQFPTAVVFVTHYTLAPHPALQRDHSLLSLLPPCQAEPPQNLNRFVATLMTTNHIWRKISVSRTLRKAAKWHPYRKDGIPKSVVFLIGPVIESF